MDDLLAPILLSAVGALAIVSSFCALIWAAVQDGRDDRRYQRLR
jgi:hypothetical protein